MGASSPSILLIEDDEKDALLIQRKIKHSWPAAHITKVCHLGQAYETCKTNAFDLILLDLNLPDGFGALSVSQLRSFEKSTPITVLTGVKTPINEREAVRLGAKQVLQKSEFLNKAIESSLGLHMSCA